jgi:DNA-binding NarL/FixJ family response regulator
MRSIKLGPALGAAVAMVAALNTLSALSMPVRDRKPALALVALWLVLLSLHAAVYVFGDRVRERFGLRTYVIAQATLIFAVAVSGAAPPITVGLLMAGTAELVVLAGSQWGTTRITVGAIALFVLAAAITSDLYRATTAGLMLAVTGLLAHAVAGLLGRAPSITAPPALTAEPVRQATGAAGLSSREIEVLRELVSGARNSDIASRLGISERTVKSHVGSIYQKLGVESRSAAVAAAFHRKLV